METHIILYSWLGWMKKWKQVGPHGAAGQMHPLAAGKAQCTWKEPAAAALRRRGSLAAKVQNPTVLSKKRAFKIFYWGLKILLCEYALLLFFQCSCDFSKSNLARLPQMP